MRYLTAAIVILACSLAASSECKVTCPSGYKGSCVCSDSGCTCSCKEETKAAKADILSALTEAHASDAILRQARERLEKVEELPETTLSDPQARQKFIIFLSKQ
jgi:hypothetical protein